MLKGSRFRFFSGLIIASTLLLFGFREDKISDRLQEKINTAIQGTYEVDEFSMDLMNVSADLNGNTPSELGGENLFRITAGEKKLGYVYVGVAPSLKKTFDYVVLLNPDLSVKKSKILIYREDHGRQVGSQRWLKQFIGRKSGEKLVYGKDIDGISGATVSAKSMTLAVNNVLESLQILKNNNFF